MISDRQTIVLLIGLTAIAAFGPWASRQVIEMLTGVI